MEIVSNISLHVTVSQFLQGGEQNVCTVFDY